MIALEWPTALWLIPCTERSRISEKSCYMACMSPWDCRKRRRGRREVGSAWQERSSTTGLQMCKALLSSTPMGRWHLRQPHRGCEDLGKERCQHQFHTSLEANSAMPESVTFYSVVGEKLFLGSQQSSGAVSQHCSQDVGNFVLWICIVMHSLHLSKHCSFLTWISSAHWNHIHFLCWLFIVQTKPEMFKKNFEALYAVAC